MQSKNHPDLILFQDLMVWNNCIRYETATENPAFTSIYKRLARRTSKTLKSSPHKNVFSNLCAGFLKMRFCLCFLNLFTEPQYSNTACTNDNKFFFKPTTETDHRHSSVVDIPERWYSFHHTTYMLVCFPLIIKKLTSAHRLHHRCTISATPKLLKYQQLSRF